MAKILNTQSFIVKNGQQKPTQNRGDFCCIVGFFFLDFFVFFLLVSSHLLLFHDILEPQNSPPNEVTGTNTYGNSLFKYTDRGKTPWVVPACADCPGFLVWGSAPDPASTLVSEPQIVPLDYY